MKSLFSLAVLISFHTYAQNNWSETFKLPEGITHRARMAGFDCGSFGTPYVSTPAELSALQVTFRQLAADKDLNKFVIEATYPGTEEKKTCTYGAYLDRNRDLKTLDFNHSLTVSDGSEDSSCAQTKEVLDSRLRKASYEGSKRGLRYVAVQIITNESNEVCESGNVRLVFDRRFQ
jgi:hypothetical protein